MPPSICSTGLALSLLGVACGDSTIVDGESLSEFDGKTDLADGGEPAPPPPPLPQECASNIFVGRLGGGATCMDHGSWHGVALGGTGILTEFCEYTWQEAAPPDLIALPGPGEGVFGLVESCPRVIPQADPLGSDPALRASIHAAFMAAIGKPPKLPDIGRPTLYLIDTIPDSLIVAGLRPNDPHGRSLRTLAEGILCSAPGSCPVSFINTLALPRVTPDREDRRLGGSLGSLMDLARGIEEAVRDWESRADHTRMVLTLALGWEPLGAYGPDLTGKTLDELLAPGGAAVDLQAVLATLMRAACHDAAIVAAVGNASAEPCTQTGAVGPALLQSLEAPTMAQCEAAGFPHASVLDAVPLLLSAAHVDLLGRPPGNVRQDASAGVTAQGVTFSAVDGTEPLLTGSSLAALTTAAAISAVWSVCPDRSRAEVLSNLAGDDATGVNICRAIQRTCGGVECPDTDPNTAASVHAAIQDALAAPDNQLQLGDDYPGSVALGANACGSTTTSWLPTPPLPPPEPPLPWTTPQPKKPYCPTCLTTLQNNPPKLTVGLSLPAAPTGPYPLIVEVQTAHGIERYPIDPAKLVVGLNNITILPAIPWLDILQIRLVHPVQDNAGAWFMRTEPLLRDLPACGDGSLDADEDCDDANLDDTDACTSACVAARCGDGIVRASVEACDDGNLDDTDACTNACALPTCGDGLVQKDEDCDDANADNTDACLATCLIPSCGDGFINAGVEACDDANTIDEDACVDCVPAVCGDGFVHAGVEACDDANADDTDVCTNACATPSCGDGFVQVGETCDDANADNTDACLATCLDPFCGDGFVQAGEEACDDANADNTDTCLDNCLIPFCGDGYVQVGELCDDANTFNGDTCGADCLALCGNGIREGWEQCDDANQDDADYCTNICHHTEACVDGYTTPCDADIVLTDKSDFTSALQAIGLCGNGYASMSAKEFAFDIPDPDSWQVAKAFGDSDDNLGYTYWHREGEYMLLLSTGAISSPQDGIVTSSGSDDNNMNPAWGPLPAPLSAEIGHDGDGPFHGCDGVGDCSGTLADQWQNDGSYDRLFFRFSTEVPQDTYGYAFDVALCTSEWTASQVRANDLLTIWQSDTSPGSYTGNVALIPDPALPGHVLPLAIGELNQFLAVHGHTDAAPQLTGTGFEGHACTAWMTLQGQVKPGGEVTIGILLTDMVDDAGVTLIMLDHFRWGCVYCSDVYGISCEFQGQ